MCDSAAVGKDEQVAHKVEGLVVCKRGGSSSLPGRTKKAPQTARFAPLVPFCAGPAEGPGRNLVLLTTSSLLAALLERHRLRQAHERPLAAGEPLPGTLSPFRPRYEVRGRDA
jgi:hypothetical protein